jgi:hypothetical protein
MIFLPTKTELNVVLHCNFSILNTKLNFERQKYNTMIVFTFKITGHLKGSTEQYSNNPTKTNKKW